MEGVIGSSYQSDIAVDDIYLSKGTCCQLKHRAFDIASVGELKIRLRWVKKSFFFSLTLKLFTRQLISALQFTASFKNKKQIISISAGEERRHTQQKKSIPTHLILRDDEEARAPNR